MTAPDAGAGLRHPILADYAISPLTEREAKRYDPAFVATFGGMTRRWPVTLDDLREFQTNLAAFIAALEQSA